MSEDPSDSDLEPSLPAPREPSLLATSLSVLGLGVGVFLLLGLGSDIAYFFSSGVPVDLGKPGDYHTERAEEGRLARIEGAGRVMGHYDRFEWGDLRKHAWEVVVVTDSDFLVRRETPANAGFSSAEGRLIRDDHVPELASVFKLAAERGGLAPKGHGWILFDGERPRRGWVTPVLTVALVLFIAANGAALLRALGRKRVSVEGAAAG